MHIPKIVKLDIVRVLRPRFGSRGFEGGKAPVDLLINDQEVLLAVLTIAYGMTDYTNLHLNADLLVNLDSGRSSDGEEKCSVGVRLSVRIIEKDKFPFLIVS